MKKNAIETAKFAASNETLNRDDVSLGYNFQKQLCIQRKVNPVEDTVEGMFLLSERLGDAAGELARERTAEALKNIEFMVAIDNFKNDALAFLPILATMIPLNTAAEALKKVAAKVAAIEAQING